MMKSNFSRYFVIKPTPRRCVLNIKNYSQEAVFASQSQNVTTKTFHEIPGPSGKGLPFLGHMNDLIKKPHGMFKTWENIKDLKTKLMTENEKAGKLLKLNLPLLNVPSKKGDVKYSNGWVVVLLDPKDIPVVYQNEGKYPFRGNVFEMWKMMRESRQDIFHHSTGMVFEDGEKWHEARFKVQQDLMRPKSALYYLNEIDAVAHDFVSLIRKLRSKEDQTIENFLPTIYRFTFESICTIALEQRIGSLNEPLDPEISKLFQAVKEVISSYPDFMISQSWKYLPQPRWNKTYRKCQDNLNHALDFIKPKIEERIRKIEKQNEQNESHDVSVLEKMILRNEKDSSIPMVTAIDIIFAGIDTTGNTLGHVLYHLAANPEQQEILRKECQSIGNDLKVQDLSKMKYLMACIKEAMRLSPTVSGNLRVIENDVVIQGYEIPKGTMLWWLHSINNLDENVFPNPNQFIPERWIENKNEIPKFANRQFSHGPRMCVGKRFADLELQIAIHKIISNFKIEWMRSEPMTIHQEFINVPDQTLDFKFTDVN